MKSNEYIDYITALEGRRILSKDERTDLMTHYNGKEGEAYFKAFLNTLENILYIHSFEFGTTNHVQIDFLVATPHKLFIFEVKHYRDEWYFENGTLKNNYGIVTKSPITQVQYMRNELQKLLHDYGIFIEIKSLIVFTNPQFIPAGNWPHDQNILFLNQLNKIVEILSSKLPNNNHQILNLLLEHESKHSTYYQKDFLTYYNLNLAGLKCPCCRKMHTIKVLEQKVHYNCTYCHTSMTCEKIVLFNLKELYILKRDSFTLEEAITWCSPISKYRIARVCNKHFTSGTRRNRKFYLK